METFIAREIGGPKDRRDGRAKVTGAARFAAENNPKGVVHAVAVGSRIARGELLSVDSEAARRAGAILVMTPFDAPKLAPGPTFSSGKGAM